MNSSRREFLKQAVAGSAALALPALSQHHDTRAAQPKAQTALPRWRGFNLLDMFTMRSKGDFTEDDFRWIRDFGFDFVRFPAVYRLWIEDGDDYKIHEPMLARPDRAIDLANKYGLHVSLNKGNTWKPLKVRRMEPGERITAVAFWDWFVAATFADSQFEALGLGKPNIKGKDHGSIYGVNLNPNGGGNPRNIHHLPDFGVTNACLGIQSYFFSDIASTRGIIHAWNQHAVYSKKRANWQWTARSPKPMRWARPRS